MFLYKDKKSGYYYIHYAENGKRKKTSCKTKLKTDALKFLQNYSTEPTELKPVIKNFNSLKIEVLKYAKTNFNIKTIFEYENVIKHFSIIAGNKSLNDITMTDAEMYKTMRLKTVKPATLNKDIGTLRAVFNYGMKLKWVKENPFKSVNKISIPEREYLAFSEIEITALLNGIDNNSIKSFVLFALLTGCRMNEIINLQINDINFKDRLITIRNKATFKTKTGKIRDIPISDNLFNLLNEIVNVRSNGNILNFYNPDQYLFTNSQKYKFTKDYITHYFKKVLRKLNFDEKYHFHCLRHTFITTLIKAGVNINYVKEIAGHSEIGTTMNYIHISTNDLRDAVNKINLFI